MKVSVVIPVYNPGSFIEPCIESLLAQSLPATDYEVVFVDDGSTDGTGQRLDDVAAEHDNIRTLHIPNSGWPGKPRNVGLDAATGDYVYFVDNDDWLGPEALERLVDRAERAGADIVIGKVVGHGGKVVTRELFRRSQDGLTFPESALLLSLMSPHKLFRRELLTRAGIRFPEGRRRLEDHIFVLRAYFAANAVSVLADYDCYHWVGRPDDSNASRATTDWTGYFANLAEVFDIVDEHVPPGPVRDRLYRHWVRFKVLRRLGNPVLLSLDPDERRQLYDAAHALARERFTEGMLGELTTNIRVRGRLLIAGRLDALEKLAGIDDIRAVAEVTAARGASVDVRVGLVGPDGATLAVARDGDRYWWHLPDSVVDSAVTEADLDLSGEIRRARLDLLARERDTKVEYVTRCHDVAAVYDDATATVHVTGTARLDPAGLAAGGPLSDGVWDLSLRVVLGGWDRTARLPAPGDALTGGTDARARPWAVYRTSAGNLSIRVGHRVVAAHARHQSWRSALAITGRVARRLGRTTRSGRD